MPDFEDISPRQPIGGIEIAPGVRVSENDLRIQSSRGSGPGGQNVNKVNTKVELWLPIAALTSLSERAKTRLATLAAFRLTQRGEIHIASDTMRTQEANRAEVFSRLRELIIQAQVEPKRRKKTKPSRGAKERRLQSKKKRGETKSQRRFRNE